MRKKHGLPLQAAAARANEAPPKQSDATALPAAAVRKGFMASGNLPAAQGVAPDNPLLVSGLPSYLTEDKVRASELCT